MEMMTPIPLDQLIHGIGTACLSLMTLGAISSRSRLAPLLAIVTGLVGYWMFLILPVLMIGPALASLLVTDLGIVHFVLRRARRSNRMVRHGVWVPGRA